MPIRELMTWIPTQRRWCKMYRGHRYYISARQLGCPETKEASVLAAKEWWRNKQADLDLAVRENARKPRPMEDIAAATLGGGDWPDAITALLRQLGTMLPSFGTPVQEPRPLDEHDLDAIKRQAVREFLEGVILRGEPIAEQVLTGLSSARIDQLTPGAAAIRGDAVTDPARTVQAQVDAWLAMQRSHVAIRAMTPIAANNLRICVGHCAAFFGETSNIEVIDAERLGAFYRFCLSKIGDSSWSAEYAKTVFAKSRAWLRWLGERGIIPALPNLNSRSFRFESTLKQIKTWTVEEVREVLSLAPGKLRLALLLMLNCGMVQRDVSDLRDTEVDWKSGRITRKRSKTAKHASVPTVCYPLWPQTFILLKEHRSGQDHVLLTKRGVPYIESEMIGGKLRRTDGFIGWYKSLQERLSFRKPLKLLRKTSASILEAHATYGRCTTLFLGHAPATMKDRYYTAPPQALFDQAVAWLGQQFGFVE